MWLFLKDSDDSDYNDAVEVIALNNGPFNISNNNSGKSFQKDVIQNPYYNKEENVNQTGSTLKVMENRYYGEAENNTANDKITVTDNSYYGGVESNTTNDNIIVVDNPYYEGIRNEND